MCGRFTVRLTARAVVPFGVVLNEPLAERYNVAPSQMVPVVRIREGKRELVGLRWGLIPSWAADPAIGYQSINARAETVANKPTFRDAFRERRCLVLASSFYEWARDSGAKRKQPYAVELAGDPAMPLAGLWESWISHATGEVIETCTIITCPANELISPLHNRMPVILPRDTIDRWLDPDTPVAELQAMLVPLSADAMHTYPVSRRVNDPRHDAPDCIEPAPLPGSQDWWTAE